MRELLTIILVSCMMFSANFGIQNVLAQEVGGGVNKPGDWYLGEGLKQGDYFSYNLCHVDYKECAPFRLDFWIEGDITVGSETKWLAQAVVYDGNKIVKGTMHLGKVAPEPTGGSSELTSYRSAFKSSVAWLSAFATSYGGEGGEGPKKFTAPSWGKIGNIGGQQVRPTSIQTITAAGQSWETVLVSWYTGGRTSTIWVVDAFPFPVKASTYTHVSEGIPPQEYDFILREYKQNVQENPFSGIVATDQGQATLGCAENFEFKYIERPTKNSRYLIELNYGPQIPKTGCDMEWVINFKNKFDQTEFLNQVQYDILVVDENLTPLRSLSQEEGKQFFYSPSGQVRTDVRVKESAGTAHYVIWVYGLSPPSVVPSTPADYLQIDITITGDTSTKPPTQVQIPSWIKNNAGWWADGQIDDNSFVQGIQWLIQQGIMKIPPTSPGTGTGSNEIPSWIKNNAGWWADGQIDDNSFVQGIQWLIQQGIMKLA